MTDPRSVTFNAGALRVVFLIVAILLFLLAAFGVGFGAVNLVDVGLACLAFALLF